ncbi:ABC transporter substrate-binding protein [Paenibacillus sp. IB182493]|uniref:ABC transporter substrate-binding protein n=2 Tax=Paenibacillus arenilitoris TaxID=2772299 RepID=A0A927CL43_9BACL|nr:ABC transporter substrate-binding protein [Paenibacillus arenilitoris]
MIRKKAIIVAAASILLLGVTACSGGNNGGNAGNKGNAEGNAGSTNANAPADSGQREPYKIEVLSQLANFAGEQGGWYGKIIKDKFGLEANITAPNLAGGAAKFATLMASGDLGDLVIFGNDGQEYRDAIKAGLLLDWTKDGLLEKYGKDILANVPEAIEKNKKNFGEGAAVYGIGHDASNMPPGPSEGNTMTYQLDMRWDLYQKLGSPKLTKMEDILPLLKQMQELEPKSDSGRPTYGFSMWADWDGNYMTLAKQFATMHGYDIGDGFNQGSLLEIAAHEDKYQGILDENSYYLRTLKLYYDANQMGLMDPDSLTQKFDDVVNKFKDGQVLFSWFPWLDSSYNIPEHTDAGKGFQMVGFEEQKIYSYGFSPYGSNRIWAIGAKAKNPERILEYINWLYTPEGMMATANGPEGLTWEMKDGKAVLTDFGKQALKDNSVQVPEEFGGGTYKDGGPKFNNSTLKPSSINPNTNEPYDWNMWTSVLQDNPNPVDKSWREATGALTPKDLLVKNGQIALNTPISTTEAPAVMDSMLSQKLSQVGAIIKEQSWKMVFAKNDAEYDKLKNEMIEKAKGLGYDEIIDWQVEQTEKVFALRNK